MVNNLKIFSKERVGNFVAGTTIFYTLYAIVFQSVSSEILPVLTALSGFASKHLWDSYNSEE
tara:strand:- start:2471 stop:2656 length:186 start_codon:yes stop_codon:yes gene_type:complete